MTQIFSATFGASLQMEGASASDNHDALIMKIVEKFRLAHSRIDRALLDEAEIQEPELLQLHRQWENACATVADLRALGTEARRAKAEMLLAALEVLAPDSQPRELHERLAASLANDLLC